MYKSILRIFACLFLTLHIATHTGAKKALFVVDAFPWYTQASLFQHIGMLQKNGFDVSIYARWKKDVSASFPTQTLQFSGKVYHGDAPNDIASYDVMICQSGTLAQKIVALKKKKNLKTKIVSYVKKEDCMIGWEPTDHTVYKLQKDVDLFLCNSEYQRYQLICSGCPESKIAVVPKPIDLEKYQFRLRVLGADQTIKLISVGPLTECRVYQDAIRAIAKCVVKQCSDIAIEYCIVGNGPAKKDILETIQHFGLEKYVKVIGWRSWDDIRKMLQESHIFLLPLGTTDDGKQEGIPEILKEAMATGTIVITTRHGGIPELIEHNKTGYIAPEHDHNYFGYCIRYALRHSEYWPRIQLEARDRIEQMYTKDTVSRIFVKALRTLFL